jgi:hypothetical protein
MSAVHAWEPFSELEVSNLLRGLDTLWWFAGGQAIDAFLGYASREHGDIDVACLRRDQRSIQRHLVGWDLWCAEAGELRPWREVEWLEPGIHDIWCRRSANAPWRLQLMLDESDGDTWVYRRDTRVRRPLTSIYIADRGSRYLAVEVQLLYKAGRPGAAPVAKNEADFAACLPRLNEDQAEWLAEALEVAHPGHLWLRALGDAV